MLFKNYWGSIGCWWTCAHLSLIFIKVQQPQILLRAAQILDVLNFFKKKVLSDVRSEIHLVRRNIISTGQSVRHLKKIIFRPVHRLENYFLEWLDTNILWGVSGGDVSGTLFCYFHYYFLLSLRYNIHKITNNYVKLKLTVTTFKVESHLPKKLFICFNESLLKMMKNTFYFTLKAVFVLQILKFLSWLFRHVGKTAWLER